MADLNPLALKTPAEGTDEVTVTSAMHNQAMAPVWEAELLWLLLKRSTRESRRRSVSVT
ncbi:hypothetical protein ACX80D_17440 [Arthrobacter sp. Sr24]